ncbi:MAG: HU family DNA-binding protein [Nitrosarchaeum sp.]|nr:HU family DNA-binding protein [Nitrosarchaeum sp.]
MAKADKAAAPATDKVAKKRRTKEQQFRMPDLITVVQEVTSLSRRESKVAIQAVIYAIKKGMLDKGYVKIPGFGKFVKIHKKATERKSFGKMTKIPEKDVVKFRPLKSLKQLINGVIALEQYVAADDNADEGTEKKTSKKAAAAKE